MSEQEVQPEVQNEVPPAPPKPPGLMRRVGCTILVVIWFAFVLSPCALLTLARDGQLSITTGELPGQEMRIWLVMEIDQRGVGISTTSQREVDGAQCLQTDVRFVFWQGEDEPLSYCECYTRTDTESMWTPVSNQQGMCTP